MRPTRSSREDGISTPASLTWAFRHRTRDSYSFLMPRKPITLARRDCTDEGSADAVERSY
jgi:hypothetical protein